VPAVRQVVFADVLIEGRLDVDGPPGRGRTGPPGYIGSINVYCTNTGSVLSVLPYFSLIYYIYSSKYRELNICLKAYKFT
jgi:hypothetical protein